MNNIQRSSNPLWLMRKGEDIDGKCYGNNWSVTTNTLITG